MNSGDPRHANGPYGGNGYGGQGGYDGHGGPGGPGGYVANGAYGTQIPAPPARANSHRGAWIGAGATLVAAVIGVVGAYLVSSNNNGNANPAPPAAQGPATGTTSPGEEVQGGDKAPSDSSESPEATPSSEVSEAAESSEPPAPVTPSGKPAGTVEWQGALALTYAENKDLDSTPPAHSGINVENDVSIYTFGTSPRMQLGNGVKSLVWKDASKAPAYADCAGVVDTLGTSVEVELKTGLALCVSTNDGRLARLTVKELSGLASDTTGVFDVVVWSR
ncbi:hypothetical protein ACFU5Y_13380 [Streptomyces gardneri]|uniref:hypothetical protein n=1 Tax=Streptomyces gardneri TaxID=66892 RepID=UPI0036911803